MENRISRYLRQIGASTLVLTALLWSSHSMATRTYWIDEATDFTGNGCENTDLNDVTSDMKTMLDRWSFSGTRWTNANAWPQDFAEACDGSFYPTGGIDSSAADSQILAVYAGHGNVGLLQFGTMNNGQCVVDFSSNMRLGAMAGAGAGHAVYVTSCTLKIESLTSEANANWLRQQFGFDNSPIVGNGDPGLAADCTGALTTNKNCWLTWLEDKPGWFTGENSPVVLSHGSDSSDCQNTVNTARWGADVLNSPRGGGPSCNAGYPSFWYCYNWIDHGGC
jgi:hypothetical protein